MERWYGTLRGLVAPLRRRTRCLSWSRARHRGKVWLLVSLYNFVMPHKSLRQGRTPCTPAMAIGLTDHVWSYRGVYLASGAYRPSHHEADGRTDGSSADPGSPGPTRGKDTSTSCGKDNQKRSSSSAESGVRCPLLFSRTTATLSANFLLPTPSGDQSC